MAKRKYEFRNGDVIGSWKFIEEVKSIKNVRKFLCECLECHKEYVITLESLIRSKAKMCISCSNKKRYTKHGDSYNPLYFVFKDMHSRCEYKNHNRYKDYGARGIKVCNDWRDTIEGLHTFIKWSEEHRYKKGLQIDRIDNNKGYPPDNCSLVSVSVNNFNRWDANGYRLHKGKWEAYIAVDKKTHLLGTYKTEEKALKVRKEAELKYYGEYSPSHRGE